MLFNLPSGHFQTDGVQSCFYFQRIISVCFSMSLCFPLQQFIMLIDPEVSSRQGYNYDILAKQLMQKLAQGEESERVLEHKLRGRSITLFEKVSTQSSTCWCLLVPFMGPDHKRGDHLKNQSVLHENSERQKFNTYNEQVLTSHAMITPVALHQEKHNANFLKQSAIQMQ